MQRVGEPEEIAQMAAFLAATDLATSPVPILLWTAE